MIIQIRFHKREGNLFSLALINMWLTRSNVLIRGKGVYVEIRNTRGHR